MWTCPKCGRIFDREAQGHYCQKPMTIDAYIEQQETAMQAPLKRIRETIRQAIPEAQEKISWGMPTYWKGVNLIHFAAAKKHIGLYPGPEAIEAFADRLREYSTEKGTIRLLYDKPVPTGLLQDMAIWCYKKYGK